VSEADIVVGVENNSFSQLNLLNLNCRNVSTLVSYTRSGKKVEVKDRLYRVKDFTYGIVS
jgi:hypothetical protein